MCCFTRIRDTYLVYTYSESSQLSLWFSWLSSALEAYILIMPEIFIKSSVLCLLLCAPPSLALAAPEIDAGADVETRQGNPETPPPARDGAAQPQNTNADGQGISAVPQSEADNFERLKIKQARDQRLNTYSEDVWVLSAEPLLYLNVSQGATSWSQIGFGLSLERFYKRFQYRLGIRQFGRVYSRRKDDLCTPVIIGSNGDLGCVDGIPDSVFGFYSEVGARHVLRKFAFNYAGGLEITRYEFGNDAQSEAAIRVSARAGYRFGGYGLGAGVFGSASIRKLSWGASVDLFLLY